MKIISSILVLLFVVQISVLAQSRISGMVVDKESKEAIEYANISLLSADSVFIKGVTTNPKGEFSFPNIPNEKYLVSASFIGYETFSKPFVKNSELFSLENIQLQSSGIMLAEATVTANSVIRKVDRDIIVPSALSVKSSTDGVNLLRNLQLDRLTIDPINNKINIAGGGDVQLRINGVLAEMSDISALKPEDIIRVEYHQDPGVRYNNAAAVIDFVTRRKVSGGNIALNLQNGLSKTGFAGDNFSAKVNHKKSEFSINTNLYHRKVKWTRENFESFYFSDKTIDRTEIGEPTQFKETRLNTRLNYSLVEQDKYFFNAALKYYRNDTPNDFMNRNGVIHSMERSEPLRVSNHSSSLTSAPSLDLYYQHQLKNDQTIVVNLVGTYIDSRSARNYQEWKGEELLTDVVSDISGDRYSIIGEAIYEKKFNGSKLTAGMKHSQSYMKNKYWGNTNTQINMNTAETYAFAEYQTKYKKFNYTLGLGMSRNYYSQAENKKESYILRPSLRINYDINNDTYIRLNSSIFSNAPSLADLNNVEQIIDSLQIRRGNPHLKSAWTLSNTLTAGYKYKFLSLSYFFRYSLNKNPIMSETFLEGDKFIQTVDNQKNMQRIENRLQIKVSPWKNYISISLNPGMSYFRSTGNNYTHNHTNWYVTGSLTANYKNVSLMAEFYTRQHWLYGEDLSFGERLHVVSAVYKRPKWSVSLTAVGPFDTNYKTKNSKLSALTPSISNVSTTNLTPIFLLGFSCNLDFGRSYKSGNKRLTNDDWDSGIMSGNK